MNMNVGAINGNIEPVMAVAAAINGYYVCQDYEHAEAIDSHKRMHRQ
jgi:hypothetical protein